MIDRRMCSDLCLMTEAKVPVWRELGEDDDDTGGGGGDGEDGAADIKFDAVSQRYTYSMHVSPSYYPMLIGKERATISAIQTDTGAVVKVPGPRERSETVVISGTTSKAVANARTRIEIVVETANESMDYTHFVCVPVSSSAIQARYASFVSQLLGSKDTPTGVEASIFTPPSKLHLTCILLKLFTPQKIEKTIEIMQSVQNDIQLITSPSLTHSLTHSHSLYLTD